MESSLARIVGGWYLVNFKTDLYQVEQACEKQSSRVQAQPVPKKADHGPMLVQELAERSQGQK